MGDYGRWDADGMAVTESEHRALAAMRERAEARCGCGHDWASHQHGHCWSSILTECHDLHGDTRTRTPHTHADPCRCRGDEEGAT